MTNGPLGQLHRRFLILDQVVEITTPDAAIDRELGKVLDGYELISEPRSESVSLHVVDQGDRWSIGNEAVVEVGLARRGQETIPRLLAAINRAVISRTNHFAVHAGVVGDDLRVLALIAPSGGGKSTLTTALVMEGMRYGSDEALCFDDAGRVVPYPRPIGLTAWSCRTLGLPEPDGAEAFVTVNDLNGQLLEAGRTPTHLLLPVRNAAGPALTPIPLSAAMASLIEHSFNHFRNPARAYDLATHTVLAVEAFRVDVSDPRETARFLLDRLS